MAREGARVQPRRAPEFAMGYFIAGFVACAVVSVLWPALFKRIHDAAARGIARVRAWWRTTPKQGPAE
jgi:hypothetical protein